MLHTHLYQDRIIRIRQKKELTELLGFETRNKYEIATESGEMIGFAVEEGKGLSAHLGRHFFGHWRTFTIRIFDNQRNPLYLAFHPFRFLFQRIELQKNSGQKIGALQQRFSFIYKKFDLEDADGIGLMTMSAPVWRPWTFPIFKGDQEVAIIRKKWSGILAESFTDKDNFSIEFTSNRLSEKERELILVGAFFIDLNYFENKASR